MSLANLRIVLVEPSHPGNIGAAARAMKTMGLADLWLVRPYDFPSDESDSRAVGAVDVLRAAHVCDELGEAVADCKLILGTSGRNREFPLPSVDAREGARLAVREATAGAQVAILFGTERDGLSNEALDDCTHQLKIPTSPDFKSLNLASAVQLLCYEVRMASGESEPADTDVEAYPNREELEYFFRHLESTLEARDYYGAINPERVHVKFRRLIARARPKRNELQMLHSLIRLMRRDDE